MTSDAQQVAHASGPIPTYLSTVQVGEIFGISEQAVATFARDREWPHFRIGRKVLFTIEHIHQIAALNERPVVQDATVEAANSHGQRTRQNRVRSDVGSGR